ncbi:hypothetical protein [Oceanicella sp. SM1341]|uniref:hypothetical protein n=1 Tax=Oceanicella sp. SM1341 TaxID=1548889 RepID=UPI000E484459|nr:hypothetical protein [Oceanicella sp. SM1341]
MFLGKNLDRPNNRKFVAYFQTRFDDYMRDLQIKDEAEKAKYYEGFLEGFRKDVNERIPDGKTLLITSEHFHSRLTEPGNVESLHKFVSGIFDNVKIVCYLREQSALALSLFSTAIKAGHRHPMDEFYRQVRVDNNYYNYDLFLSAWADAFGAENLVIRRFDKKHLVQGSIMKDVLTQAGLGDQLEGFQYNIPNANETLGYVGLDLGRLLNEYFPRWNEDGSINKQWVRIISLLSESKLGTMSRISNEYAQQTYEMFNESNIAVGRKFFGIDGNPFERPAETSTRTESVNLTEVRDALLAFMEGFLKEIKQP